MQIHLSVIRTLRGWSLENDDSFSLVGTCYRLQEVAATGAKNGTCARAARAARHVIGGQRVMDLII